ncbi:MAG: DNA gyrase subunit A [Chitinophagaceae bacterium]|nr:DNA gyrase subunit A [Anaerolineae bacterium]
MNIGDIQQVNIEQEMRDAYLDYAMSVIVARALPDARDGLKPVHRRILYAMYDMGLRADTAYKKSARIVGEVLGKYHPHGDAAVYESMVRLAQDFSLRYMLVAGQGNFGSIDGDGAAAMRYTEARMAEIGEELLVDIGKDTVDFTDNFDGSLQEPSVLPSSFPNLLVNGSSGIAVGMSTSIPPHNLNEICDALVYMLKNWETLDDIGVQELMKFVKGPDFPTGGLVYRHQDGGEGEDTLVTAYATGQGKIIVRAKAHIEDMGRGKARIIISEMPYQVNKTTLIERIATVVREGKIEGIADLRDESDRQGMRLVVELQRGAEPTPVLAALFKLTPLQDTFSIRILALVENQPRLLSLKQALRVYLDHRLVIIQRRSEYDLARAKERAHILEGLLKALDNLDEAIRIIRASQTTEAARDNLMNAFALSEIQSQAILDMQLRRLAALERKKIQDEYDEKIKLIGYLEGLLQSPEKMRSVISEELNVIKSAYGDKRRTVIVDGTASSARVEDLLMPEEKTWITLTTSGRLARTMTDVAPKVTSAAKEPPRFIVEGSTAHILYLFTSKGECATIPVQSLPQVEEPAEGAPFNDLCPFSSKEEIVTVLSLPGDLETGYLFFTSEGGQVKRIRCQDLPGMSSNAFLVMNIGDDRLSFVFPTDGEREILLTTDQAQSIRFKENEVRSTGLPAGGMRGIKLLGDKDKVVGANIVVDGAYVWTITDDGIAKISEVSEYPTQGRAGGGVITMRLAKTSKAVAATAVGNANDTVIILSNKDKAKPTKIGAAPVVKRGRAGGSEIFKPTRQNEAIAGVVMYQERYTAPELLPESLQVPIEPETA